jgi:phenylalanyl-tRNA synthetase beta chain
MKVLLSWLAEFVEITEGAESMAEKLTSAGMKVEKVTRPGAGVKGVLVGEVLSITPHPNAEKLTLVQVGLGSGISEIVCGATNFAVGDRVPVAVPGSTLPGLGAIQAKRLMGIVSNGMMCSASELKLGEDHSGLLILGPDAPVGAELGDVIELDDALLELEINPNRPDAMGLLGVAREVAACTGAALKPFTPKLKEGRVRVERLTSIEVADPAGCPRYLGRVVEGVTASNSSSTLARHRLLLSGMRPLSAVVDATNYALMVTGQPLHAFDLDRLDGGRIVVRRAEQGETLTTIDGTERALDPDDLVIADGSKPVALAGVMGGVESEVSAGTSRILLESAYFNPVVIFRSAKRHNVRSEASSRMERGTDPNGVDFASQLATSLILEWAGGTAATGAIDIYPNPIEPRVITLRPKRARKLLGVDWRGKQMAEALERLGLSPAVEKGMITTVAPTYRVDLKAEEDLIEEVARVTGYDQIPTTLPKGRNRIGSVPPRERQLRRLKRVLTGAGLFEAHTSSLVGPADLRLLGGDPAAAGGVMNPLTQEESLLRTSLLPGLLRSVAGNLSRRPGEVRLFEAGKVFIQSGGGESMPGQIDEHERLGVVMAGQVSQQWYASGRPLDFFDLKGTLEIVTESLRIPGVTYQSHSDPPYHPTRAAALVAGSRQVGLMGELGEEAAAKLGLSQRVMMGEFDLDVLLELASPPGAIADRARFPAVFLDIAVALSEDVPAELVISTARAAGGEYLESVRLIDVYRGDQLGEGRKSLALALTFRSGKGTLQEGEAIHARDSIAAAISEHHGGTIRA